MPTNTINLATINPVVSYSLFKSLSKPSGIIYLTTTDLPKAKTPPYPYRLFHKTSILLPSLIAKA